MSRKKLTIEFVRGEFEKKGCKLISNKYINNKTKLDYICKNNHNHSITYHDFQRGYGCNICYGNKKLTIEFIRGEFEKRGCKLISDEYINNHAKLNYICKNNHNHSISYNNFRQGYRCDICYGNKKHTIEFIREEFEKQGYKLLSDEYINNKTKLQYICDKGHNHSIKYNSFQGGHGCPYCCQYKSEELTREIFEKIYNEKFPKQRPEFLKQENGYSLELDGYNQELRIAFEYQGIQHYEYNEHFHKTEDDFKKRQERDEWKYHKCVENDIILILIPYHFNYQNPEKLEQYIREQLITHKQL